MIQGRLGSICISLTDLGTDREDVLFELYKVGTLKAGSDYQWVLDEALVGTGVDLNSMDTTEKTMEITQTLADAVEDSGLKALSGTTDSEGKAEFTGLTQGKYLLIQPGDDYGIVSPSLVTVPYWEEEWIYDVEVTPKAAAPGEEPGKPTGTKGRPISPNLSTKKNTQDPVRRSSVKQEMRICRQSGRDFWQQQVWWLLWQDGERWKKENRYRDKKPLRGGLAIRTEAFKMLQRFFNRRTPIRLNSRM